MRVEDFGIPEPTPEESLQARIRFYRILNKSSKAVDTQQSDFMIAACALATGYFPGSQIGVDNETPSDMDGYVFKVTIA